MEVDMEIFLCHHCGKTFHKLSTLESHTKWKHSEKTMEYICHLCGRTFQKKYNLQKHMQTGMHSMTETVNCAFDDCGFRSMNRKIMGNHYERYHGLSLREKTVYFNNFEDFSTWKSEFENKTKARFVKMSSSRIKKNGCMKSTYFCHRDGNFVPKGKNLRQTKVKGSNKINAHCPAKIDVEVGEKLVVASYINSHLGHDSDITRMSLDVADKALIARKLEMKVPFEEILNELNSMPQSSDSGFKRLSLITRKDLWNIVDTFKLNSNNIAYSRNRMRRKRPLGGFKKVQKYNVARQSHSQNDEEVIFNLEDLEENQIVSINNENFILVKGEDDDVVQEYALISDENEVDAESCLFINAQGELESVSGHQVIYTNDEGEVIYEEGGLNLSDETTPVITDTDTESGEVPAAREEVSGEEEALEVTEIVTLDDIVYIDGEAYRLEKSEEEDVETDEVHTETYLPESANGDDVQDFEPGGVLEADSGLIVEEQTIVKTEIDVVDVEH